MCTKKFFILKKPHLDFLIGSMNGFTGGIVHRVHNSFWSLLSKLLIFVLELVFSGSRVGESIDAKDEALSENGNEDGQNEEESSVFNKYEFFHGNGVSGFLHVPEVESFTVQELYSYLESGEEAGGLREEGFAEGFVFEKVEVNRGSRIPSGGPETEDFSFTAAERLLQEPEEAGDEQTRNATVSADTEETDLEEDDCDLNFIVESRLETENEGGDENTKSFVSVEAKDSDLETEGDENPDVSVSIDSERNWSEDEEDFSLIVDQRTEKLEEEADEETEKADSEEEEISNVKQPKKLADEVEKETEESVLAGSSGSEEFIEMQPRAGSFNLEVVGNSRVLTPPEQIPMWDSSDEEDHDFDSDEDDDIIEQLKMEIRNARTGGLPTILEESESPKMVQEFKPLVFEEKLDHIADINKVFKAYEERMKKLDILNCQTMHAIDLLQLKGPNQSDTTNKKSNDVPLKSFWPFRQREADDANTRSIRGLNKDLETVYVGQICLSWEILNWQYDKALKLLESGHQRSKQYNQVAGEFQLFQVLLQRFLEDEPFHNVSRVQNYVKHRFVFRKFLQVPSLRDDHSKDRNGNTYREEKSVISIEELADIMEESMQLFLGFLRADKHECSISSKTPQITQVAPQDPAGSELLIRIRTDFQKKERELKEIVRSSSCMLKKFQKQQPRRSLLNHHAYLVAQAELKLVSRALNMSKMSADQIVWCQEKLEKLKFCSRKIEIEPSCLLFPC